MRNEPRSIWTLVFFTAMLSVMLYLPQAGFIGEKVTELSQEPVLVSLAK